MFTHAAVIVGKPDPGISDLPLPRLSPKLPEDLHRLGYPGCPQGVAAANKPSPGVHYHLPTVA